jgi:hypothetical protein
METRSVTMETEQLDIQKFLLNKDETDTLLAGLVLFRVIIEKEAKETGRPEIQKAFEEAEQLWKKLAKELL